MNLTNGYENYNDEQDIKDRMAFAAEVERTYEQEMQRKGAVENAVRFGGFGSGRK